MLQRLGVMLLNCRNISLDAQFSDDLCITPMGSTRSSFARITCTHVLVLSPFRLCPIIYSRYPLGGGVLLAMEKLDDARCVLALVRHYGPPLTAAVDRIRYR